MMEYDVAKIQELFKNHSITDFEVKDVYQNENKIFICVEQENRLGLYIKHKCISYLKFKSNNIIYEVQSFHINISGAARLVFVIKKGKSIAHVLSLYEITHYEQFDNEYLTLVIDEIIEED